MDGGQVMISIYSFVGMRFALYRYLTPYHLFPSTLLSSGNVIKFSACQLRRIHDVKFPLKPGSSPLLGLVLEA